MKCLEVYGKPVPLHCVFHGIRFKVNGRLVVEMTTFFFLKRRVRVDAPLFAVTTHSLNLETWGGLHTGGGSRGCEPRLSWQETGLQYLLGPEHLDGYQKILTFQKDVLY